jgi:hypothetical protein
MSSGGTPIMFVPSRRDKAAVERDPVGISDPQLIVQQEVIDPADPPPHPGFIVLIVSASLLFWGSVLLFLITRFF